MRLLWGLLLLLALAASPLLALALLVAILALLLHPQRRRGYGRPSVTLRGEVVRSRSEKVVADWFYQNGVRYIYELPVFDRRGVCVGVPDFYLPDYGVCVEFWGLVNVPDNFDRSRYERSMRWNMAQYRRNGIRFTSLYPSELGNLDAAFRPKLEQAADVRWHSRV